MSIEDRPQGQKTRWPLVWAAVILNVMGALIYFGVIWLLKR